MPITEPEWASIAAMVEKLIQQMSGSKTSFFTTGKVVKSDKLNKCVYLTEFGDQPIPVVGFDYEITYYDQTPAGTNAPASGQSSPYTTRAHTVQARVVVPKVGDTVFVAREMGTRRLPRCLGVIQGIKWILPEED